MSAPHSGGPCLVPGPIWRLDDSQMCGALIGFKGGVSRNGLHATEGLIHQRFWAVEPGGKGEEVRFAQADCG
jgi:hypothetical protein